MSTRQAHLPPRCPFQRKPVSHPIQDSNSISPPINSYKPGHFPSHHRSPSQGSILEDQPAWLEELLSDPEVNAKGGTHRRSASDSIALLDGDSLSDLHLGSSVKQNDFRSQGREMPELDCIYGPNSPRGRSCGMTFSDSGIVSALSEYISQNPLELLDGSLCISGTSKSNLKGDASPHGANGELGPEMKPGKSRHSGQRSRVRKLQYIAELEKTVNIFQAFESELAVRVASLLQHRVTLTMENTKLKQQMARVGQKKFFLEGQYQSLRKEAEMLKAGLANSPGGCMRANSEASHAAKTGISEATWQSLGLEKLNLD